MTDKLNKLFFFTDRWYTMPGDTYNFGVLGAEDTKTAKLVLGTELVDGKELGQTDTSGQIVCATALRDIDPRTKAVEHTVECEYYRLKDGVDVSERVEQIRAQISKMYGIDCSGMTIDFSRALRIPGEYTSTGGALWQVECKHPDYEQTNSIMLAAERNGSITLDDAANFEATGEKSQYKYVENEELPLTPEWLILDLLEKAGLGGDSWAVLADAARKVAYSSTEVEGWSRVDEVYGQGANGHVISWWLNPGWEKLITDAINAITADEAGAEAKPLNLADEMAGEIPGLDEDMTVDGGVDPSNEEDNCAGGACKI